MLAGSKAADMEAQREGFKAVNATGCLEWAGGGKRHFFDAGAPEIAEALRTCTPQKEH